MNYLQDFAGYLKEIWDLEPPVKQVHMTKPQERGGIGFPVLHEYSIIGGKEPVWRQWHQHKNYVPQSGIWWCTSLLQARNHYSWSIASTGKDFDQLSIDLNNALAQGDEVGTKKACLRIFEWGGVAKNASDRSRVWVVEMCEQGRLCSRLKDGFAILKSPDAKGIQRFDGADLLMNSALTKVFAAIGGGEMEGVVMYDGRVGAALGLLARRFLGRLASPPESVPPELAFRWGPPQVRAQAKLRARDPSDSQYAFRQLNYPGGQRYIGQNNRSHAELVRLSTDLLSRMRSGPSAVAASVREIEQALFMIGYWVR